MPVPRNRAGILHARLQQLGTLENAHTFNSSKPSFCSHFNSSLIKITQFVHPYYKMSTIKLSNFRMNIRQALKKPFTTTKWQKGRTTQQLCPVALPACLSPPYCLKWFFLYVFCLSYSFCAVYSHTEADVSSQCLLEANVSTEVCLTVLDTLSIFIMGFKVSKMTNCCNKLHLLKRFYI